MRDVDDVRDGAGSAASEHDERAERIERKTEELGVFRDAGLLTDNEYEEQKTKLRWS